MVLSVNGCGEVLLVSSLSPLTLLVSSCALSDCGEVDMRKIESTGRTHDPPLFVSVEQFQQTVRSSDLRLRSCTSSFVEFKQHAKAWLWQ